MQVASLLGRNEPDCGEVHDPRLFRVIDEIGYDGRKGCDYRPAGKASDGLAWSLAASGSVK
jgi:hydroxypyruvate isomerase